MHQCSGIKRDGSRCTVTVEPPQTYCWWHDPQNAEQRSRAAARGGKRGGRGRPLAELADIKGRLSELGDKVLAGEVNPRDAAVVGQLLNYYLHAINTELKVKEQVELIERIEILEQRL